jgi:uncharacterized protein YkwD
MLRRVQTGVVRILLALVVLVQMLSCAAPRKPMPAPQEPTVAGRTKPSLSIAELEREVHLLVNKERQARGLSPLSWNRALAEIARKHSQDMAVRNFFSHQSPDGHGFPDRYRQANYSCSVPRGNIIHTGAENIFQNNTYDRVIFRGRETRYDWNTMREIAETTVQGWMNSPGHRKNILTPFWESEGIGVAVSADDKVYITQNFC